MSDTLHLRGLWHLVELLETQTGRVTASGIALPDTYAKNDCCALVLASGPGLDPDGPGFLPPVAQSGDLVLFDYGDFHPLQEGGGRRGFVYDTRLVGWQSCDAADSAQDRPVPLNEWCLVRVEERPKMAGGVALSDKAKRPRSGIVEDAGPGRLITCGPHKGRRLSCETIAGSELVGRRGHWGKEAEVVCAGRYRLEWVLIKAGDLLAVEMTPREAVRSLLEQNQRLSRMAEGTHQTAKICSRAPRPTSRGSARAAALTEDVR